MNPTDVRPFVATGNTITVAATGSSAATAEASGLGIPPKADAANKSTVRA